MLQSAKTYKRFVVRGAVTIIYRNSSIKTDEFLFKKAHFLRQKFDSKVFECVLNHE